MRPWMIAALGLALATGAAVQNVASADLTRPPSFPPPAGPSDRYSMMPTPEGFVRLDNRTGAVSHCARQEGQWLCELATESNGEILTIMKDLEERVVVLSEAVTGLSAEVAKLRQRTDTLERDAAKVATPERSAAPEPAKQSEPAPGFPDQVIRRLFGLVSQLKR